MIFVITGAPGAGKGTQSNLLIKKHSNLCKISTGDCLRKHVKEQTVIGQKISAIMESGKLVSDDILLQVLTEEIKQCGEKSVILDGYPRNINQAKTLTSMLSKLQCEVNGVFHLDVDSKELIKRLSGRRICSQCSENYHVDSKPSKKDGVCDLCGGSVVQRPDDKAEKVAVRLEVFSNETQPVLDYYKNLNILRVIDGSLPEDQVFKNLEQEILAVA